MLKMPTIVGIFTIMSMENFRLSYGEHEKHFIISESGLALVIKLMERSKLIGGKFYD